MSIAVHPEAGEAVTGAARVTWIATGWWFVRGSDESQTTIAAPTPPSPSRHPLPDPGEGVPPLSWPIVGIFTGGAGAVRRVELGGGRSSTRRGR